jgi:hypothetical protein
VFENNASSFADLFGLSPEDFERCTRNEGQGLQLCKGHRDTGYWYYDGDKNVVIFAEEPRTPAQGSIVSFFSRLKNWLLNREQPANDVIQTIGANPEAFQTQDSTIVSEDSRYDRIFYLHTRDGEEIKAIQGDIYDIKTGQRVTYISVEYTAFKFKRKDLDVCNYISNYNSQFEETIPCDQAKLESGQPYFVFTRSTPQLWSDFTAKLRLLE